MEGCICKRLTGPRQSTGLAYLTLAQHSTFLTIKNPSAFYKGLAQLAPLSFNSA